MGYHITNDEYCNNVDDVVLLIKEEHFYEHELEIG